MFVLDLFYFVFYLCSTCALYLCRQKQNVTSNRKNRPYYSISAVAKQCSMPQATPKLYCFVLHNTTLYYTILLCTTQYYFVLHSTTLYYAVLLCTTQYYVVLPNTILYYAVLLCATQYYQIAQRLLLATMSRFLTCSQNCPQYYSCPIKNS